MFFFLFPRRRSLIGHVFRGVRSAMLVGGALLLVPYLSAGEMSGTAPKFFRAVDRGSALPTIKPSGLDLAGAVTHVRDGDTLEVEGVAVRIANLDCAERGTSPGRRATDRMRSLSGRGPLTCKLSGRKSHGREIGTCRLADGRDIGAVLISEGLCRRWE